MERIKKIPLPISGLILGLAACGNLVQSHGEVYRNIFGAISAIFAVLLIIKIFTSFEQTKKDLENPVIASAFPAFSMAIMILSTYLIPYSDLLARAIWVIGLIFHIILIVWFSMKFISKFEIKKVFPSWFIVYVGIVAGSVSSKAFGYEEVGRWLFYFGLISFIVLLPVVIKRVFVVKGIPEPALPTITIMTAPAGLLLAGYMNAFENKSYVAVLALLIISQILYIYVLTQLPKLLSLKFYPSYSAFTFPTVITAIGLKGAANYLKGVNESLKFLSSVALIEEIIAVLLVVYVLIRYISFLSSNVKSN